MAVPQRTKPRPMSLEQFQRQFATDAACQDHLFRVRWGTGFECPRCHGIKGYRRRNRPLMECAGCGHQVSVMAGTVFHRSHVPLRKWFLAIFLTAQSKRGISALELSNKIGVHRETAWTMLHRIRRAMEARDALYKLTDLVEMDDAFFGGVKHGKVGRGTTQVKTLVAVSKTDKDHPKYAKIVVVKSWTQPEMNDVALATVEPGSTIRTDGMGGFGALSTAGFGHDIIPSNKLLPGIEPFPDVHTLISNAKAWILGTFHGLGPDYMPSYLAEFVYRFNRRHREHELFQRLVAACAWAPYVSIADIVA